MNTVSPNLNYNLYFSDTYKYQLTTKVQQYGRDESGFFVIPEQTIFHPQGGGQPNDKGIIKIKDLVFNVSNLKISDSYTKHYLDSDESINININRNDMLDMHIDKDYRLNCSKYHSAGHLIANIIETAYPETSVYKGNHFPNQSYIVFKKKDIPLEIITREDFKDYDFENIKNFLNEELLKYFKNNIKISVDNSNIREVKIGDLKPFSCGGTHVSNTTEIGKAKIEKIKFKKKEGVKVYYVVE